MLTLSFSSPLLAQSDSLTLINGDIIIGEIKGMEKGVLIIETAYSEKDFEIEWGGIKKLYSPNQFFITLSDGRRITASIHSKSDGKIDLFGVEDGGLLVKILGDTIQVRPEEIVYINSFEDDFLSRLSASIDVGFTLSKAIDRFRINPMYIAKIKNSPTIITAHCFAMWEPQSYF